MAHLGFRLWRAGKGTGVLTVRLSLTRWTWTFQFMATDTVAGQELRAKLSVGSIGSVHNCLGRGGKARMRLMMWR
jgi:hypothetical protein